MVKIDLGAHIDGFIAVVAHTGKLYLHYGNAVEIKCVHIFIHNVQYPTNMQFKGTLFIIVVVGQDAEKPVVDGRKADALLAAHYATEAALRLVKPGNEVMLCYSKSFILLKSGVLTRTEPTTLYYH